MWAIGCSLLTTSMIILGATGADHFHRPGRRICSSGAKTEDVLVTQSFVQPVYHPLLTLCEGHRACSTYRTTYKTAYRQVMKKMAPQPLYVCCPGWKRMDSHIQGCSKASCPAPCRNGGTCIGYNKCKCASGWRGDLCQTDVDECTMGSHRCAHTCVNTPGSFLCVCRAGFRLSADGRSCDQERPTASQPPPQPANGTGVPESVKEEIQELRNKIEVLEQKLQLVLAPFNNPATSSPEDALGSITLLTHSFQQLDRIDSLSEQISFLEERLETCSCKNEL